MIAYWHAQAIAELPNAEVVGVCDHGRGNADRVGPRCACASGVCGLERFIARDDIDLITVATPSGAHLEPALLAARHGKHCLVEKPIEITLERIDAMIEAHDKAGTLLGGIFNMRYNAPVRLCKQALEAGRLGQPTFGMAYGPWWRDQAYYDDGGWRGTLALDGGGAFMNQGIHTIDLLQWLMGPIAEVSARTATLAHERIEVEDTGSAAVVFENGALGTLACTTSMWPGRWRRVEVSGTDGSVGLVDDDLSTWNFREETDEDASIRKQYLKAPDPNAGAAGAANPSAGFTAGPHRENIADFLAAIDQGLPPVIDGREARRAVQVVLALYESARRGGAGVRVL